MTGISGTLHILRALIWLHSVHVTQPLIPVSAMASTGTAPSLNSPSLTPCVSWDGLAVTMSWRTGEWKQTRLGGHRGRASGVESPLQGKPVLTCNVPHLGVVDSQWARLATRFLGQPGWGDEGLRWQPIRGVAENLQTAILTT